ncbi:MAG: hypothetical protein LBF62_09165 [Tannerellaceae bacterium]|nr:hypothetical protein [Tannerellaceae bacterium]
MADSNRARTDLGSGTPGGLWYDSTVIPAFEELAGAFFDPKYACGGEVQGRPHLISLTKQPQ